tara:strand:- start:36803 stop:40954 length:4152 start_codon:yes stop_codon:yes gene_type:complete
MENLRAITDDEFNSISANIKSPDNVDPVLFNSYMDTIMRKHEKRIRGIENDSAVKSYLAEREQREKDRLYAHNIRLTTSMKEENNFPSEREEALPKQYDEETIPQKIQEWTNAIQKEVYETFGQLTDTERIDLKAKITAYKNSAQFPATLSENDIKVLSDKITNSEFVPQIWDLLLRKLSRDYTFKLNKFIESGSNGHFIWRLDNILQTLEYFSEKRRPTVEEVDDILSVIDYKEHMKGKKDFKGGESRMLDVVNDAAVEITKTDLRRQIKQIEMRAILIDDFKEALKQQFLKSLVLEGKLVGNVMAAAIGESSTQQTLNTFHSSGNRAARIQITGFTQLKAVLDAIEKPKQATTTIFPKGRWNGTQMRLRAINFQSTSLSDLIESHRVIESTPTISKPRWEVIRDAVFHEGLGMNYGGKSERFNLNRENPLFRPRRPSTFDENGNEIPDEGMGYILEIQLNIEKLFFLRISMKMIENSLEQHSTNIVRVTASTIDIGMIYVYVNFTSLTSMEGVNEKKPDFIKNNGFRFALENVIYPQLQSIQITGIQDLTFLNVQNHDIHKTIDFSISTTETHSAKKVCTLHIILEDLIYWGVRDNILREYVLLTMRLYAPNNHLFEYNYDENTSEVTFNTNGMMIWDEKKLSYRQIKMDDIQTLLTAKSDASHVGSKISAWDLLTKMDDGEISTRRLIQITGSDAIFSVNPNILNSSPDYGDLLTLGIDLDTIAILFSNILSDADEDKYAINREHSAFKIKNIKFTNPDEIYAEMRLVKILSERLNESRIRWYYQGDGRNFKEVLAHKDVDSEYTRTSNIVDVYRTLGVESCRSVTIKEVKLCTNSKINPAHIELLADSATATTPGQKPIPQTYHGMHRRGTGFLALSWEKSTKVFMNSGMGMEDQLTSFSSNLMTGKLDKVKLLNDEDRRSVFKDKSIFGVAMPEIQTINVAKSLEDTVEEEKIISTSEAPVIASNPTSSIEQNLFGVMGGGITMPSLGNISIPSFNSGILDFSSTPSNNAAISVEWVAYNIKSSRSSANRNDLFSNIPFANIVDNYNLMTKNIVLGDNGKLFNELSRGKTSLDEFFDNNSRKQFYIDAVRKLYPDVIYHNGQNKASFELNQLITEMDLGAVQQRNGNFKTRNFMCLNSAKEEWPIKLVKDGWRGYSHQSNLQNRKWKKANPKFVKSKDIDPITGKDCLAINSELRENNIITSLVIANGAALKKSMLTDESGIIIHREDYQELDNIPLILGEFVYLMFSSRHQTDLCLKVFDTFTDMNMSIIYVATQLFDEVVIAKPTSSKPTNSERFIICKNRNDLDSTQKNFLKEMLITLDSIMMDPNNARTSIVNPTVMEKDPLFKKTYINCMDKLAYRQLDAISKSVAEAKNLEK